jgi:hypothetical protein
MPKFTLCLYLGQCYILYIIFWYEPSRCVSNDKLFYSVKTQHIFIINNYKPGDMFRFTHWLSHCFVLWTGPEIVQWTEICHQVYSVDYNYMLCFDWMNYFVHIIYCYLYIRPLCVLSEDGYMYHPNHVEINVYFYIDIYRYTKLEYPLSGCPVTLDGNVCR